MRPRLDIKPETKLILTPMLQQALHVLQLPTYELANLVDQELSENPLLEEGEDKEAAGLEQVLADKEEAPVSEGETKEVDLAEVGSGLSQIEQTEWEEYFSNEEYEIPKFERETTSDRLEPQVAKQLTLDEHLLAQFRLISRSEEEYRIGEIITGNLDERGFLPLSLEEIGQETKADPDLVAEVLSMIQSLDPVGVAARDVKESLLIQLRYLPQRMPLAEIIIEKHFTAFERNQLEAIAKAEKVKLADVSAAAKMIAGLDPYPGRHQFTGAVEYIIPDAVIEKHDEDYMIIINDDAIPELRVSKAYRMLLRRGSGITDETRKYLSDRLQRAIGLIRSIDQRRRTLYRVVETIVEVQRDFFEKGVEYLKPLTLREIAERVNLHESTISRVTSQKYAMTPRGLLELKYFFSSQIKKTDGGNVSSTSVKATVQELISQEDPRRPFSDERIVKLLADKGLNIARRTIAKYREELNILPTSRRKRLD